MAFLLQSLLEYIRFACNLTNKLERNERMLEEARLSRKDVGGGSPLGKGCWRRFASRHRILEEAGVGKGCWQGRKGLWEAFLPSASRYHLVRAQTARVYRYTNDWGIQTARAYRVYRLLGHTGYTGIQGIQTARVYRVYRVYRGIQANGYTEVYRVYTVYRQLGIQVYRVYRLPRYTESIQGIQGIQ